MHARKMLGLLGLTLTCGVLPAVPLSRIYAQDASQYYTVQHPEQFETDWASFYDRANQMTLATRAALPHHLDLAFGEHPKQRLDLYLPEGDTENAPVLLFLHGGGFKEGDRAQYGFIAAPYARHGIITAVASYRLTSGGFHYPAQAEDAKSAVHWLYNHVADYGGDSNAIFVAGHSAGALLAADIGVDRRWLEEQGAPADIIKGIIPVSGRYAIKEGDREEYAPTAELRRRASPVYHVVDPAPAAVIAFGTEEDQLRAPSRVLRDELEAGGVDVELLALQGKDHPGAVMALGTEGTELFQAVLSMIQKAPR